MSARRRPPTGGKSKVTPAKGSPRSKEGSVVRAASAEKSRVRASPTKTKTRAKTRDKEAVLEPSLAEVRSSRTVRVIPTLYPLVDLFEDLAPPEDWEAISEIESLTNDRLRDAMGDITLVPNEERISGPGATTIMAAFTHPGPSRFSDGSYGVYYAGLNLETAIKESAAARARFYGASLEPATQFDMRVHFGTLRGNLHDVRGAYPEVHDPMSYDASQALGRALKQKQSYGVVYDSVRDPGGECVAVFRPSILRNRKKQGHTWQGPLLSFYWDGTEVARYFNYETRKWSELDA